MKNEDEQKIPVLIFLLSQNKFHEIIKAMLNRQVSTMMMEEYGQKQSQYSPAQQFRMKQAVNRFSILQVYTMLIRKQLIELKGSSHHRVKDYQNLYLHEMIRRKLFAQQICDQTRNSFWVQLSDYYSKRHLYDDLKQLQLASDFVNIIEKDIVRSSKDKTILNSAQQVLEVFARFNPYIGYCQGMNTIAAFLISKGFSCSESFFIFKRVTEQLLPCDFYTNLNNAMAYTRIVYQSLAITHPDIYHHMKTISKQMDGTYVVMVSFVLQWFVCLFCNENICQTITQAVWDFFLIQGVPALFKATYAIFDLLRPHILMCKNFGTCLLMVEEYNAMQKDVIKNIKNSDYIRKKIKQIYLSAKILFLLKEKLMQTENKNTQKIKKETTFRKNCNRSFNVCLQSIQDNLQQNKYYENFVFKTNNQIKVVENYLQTLHKQYFVKQKNKNKNDSLMIGRITHVCRNSSDTMTEGSISDKNNNESQGMKTPPRKNVSTPNSIKSSSQKSQDEIRSKLVKRIQQVSEKIPLIQKSDSVKLMEQMVKHASLSNLLEIYEIDELFQ